MAEPPQAEEAKQFGGLGLLDTATEITNWNNEAHAIGLKVLEEREKEERARQEEKARAKRSMHSLNFAPVPAAKAVVAENVAKLYLLVQKRNITPVFEFMELGIQSFGATLKINDRVFRAVGPFSSKKEAKETVARLGVEFLTGNPDLSLPKAGGVVPSGGQGAVTELNLRCQKLKMAVPEYIIPEIAKGYFSATLILGGMSFEEKGPFSNKKSAKEAVAKQGLAHLENTPLSAAVGTSSVELAAKLHSFIDRHRLDPAKFEVTELEGTPLKYRGQLNLGGEMIQNAGPFSTKQEAQDAITIQALVFLEQKYKENEENWVELLNLFAQSSLKQQPSYEDFQETSTKQNLWSSEVSIPLVPQPFGRRDLPFGSKKLARQNAAREAVLWLRENEYLPEDGPPKKKQKMHPSSISSSPGSKGDAEIRFAQQVNDLCIRHSIPVPIYNLTADPDGPFYSGDAKFPSGVIANGRPIGRVENIFGRKNAKEAVARNLVRYLEEHVKEMEVLDGELLREAGFEGFASLGDVQMGV
ncbi:Double-stranded RNA-binding protein [Venturia nashicola]|uniref:Double-stranded RNA-binding protein n=1 Tax=Venturia nashicola TaxID=86259 RepID=A0A4Z1PRS2_9PEZI|nr:Double-stranded RNA-binding protein [Venturia nashicola]TLD38763.1 Double-stranded RNA-binding protein [Venturia nashicola]